MRHIHASTSAGTRRARRAAIVAALALLLSTVAPLAGGVVRPAPAAAADYNGTVYVFPVLNCVTTGRDGSYTAVLGYRNTHRSASFTITGGYNEITPSRYDGSQPTVFEPGTHNGAFSLQVSSGTVYWNLAGTRLTISRSAATRCPADTQMPADGNGTGIVVVLAAAAVIGVLVVRRTRRKAAAGTSQQEILDA